MIEEHDHDQDQDQRHDVAALERKLDVLHGQLEELLAHQRKQAELIDELAPISREMMGVLIERLDALEERGYFTFGEGALGILDKVVTAYDADDLEELGDSVVSILDTVKSLTRPELLRMAHEASEAIRDADGEEPMGPLAVFRAASRDKDVRHGMAVLVSVLRHVGKGARSLSHDDRLKAIAPRRQLAAPRERPRRAQAQATAPAPPQPQPAVAAAEGTFEFAGQTFTAEGFLLDHEAWTPELAERVAAELGLAALTEAHWKVIRFSRETFASTGGSPNIRKISRGAGMGVSDLYTLFPDKPGVMSAQIAGLPKPRGCI